MFALSSTFADLYTSDTSFDQSNEASISHDPYLQHIQIVSNLLHKTCLAVLEVLLDRKMLGVDKPAVNELRATYEQTSCEQDHDVKFPNTICTRQERLALLCARQCDLTSYLFLPAFQEFLGDNYKVTWQRFFPLEVRKVWWSKKDKNEAWIRCIHSIVIAESALGGYAIDLTGAQFWWSEIVTELTSYIKNRSRLGAEPYLVDREEWANARWDSKEHNHYSELSRLIFESIRSSIAETGLSSDTINLLPEDKKLKAESTMVETVRTRVGQWLQTQDTARAYDRQESQALEK